MEAHCFYRKVPLVTSDHKMEEAIIRPGLESCFSDRFFTSKLFLFSKKHYIHYTMMHKIFHYTR